MEDDLFTLYSGLIRGRSVAPEILEARFHDVEKFLASFR